MLAVKKLLPLIGLVILLLIIINLDLDTLFTIFNKLNPLYAFLSIFAILPVVILINIQWQILLRKQKIFASFFYTLKNIFIGYFYGFITPGGFGGYLRALYLKYETKQPLPKCLGNIIIFNTIDFITLLVLGAIGALVLSRIYPMLFYIIVILLFFVICLLSFFLKKDRSYGTFNRIVESRVFSLIKNRIEEPLESFYEDLPKIQTLWLPFTFSFIGWLLQFSEFYLVSRLFQIHVPFIDFLLITAIANVIGVIPVSIYGLGTRDAALITLFSFYNILPERVISFSLFWFAIIWFFPSVVGAIIAIFESKKMSKRTNTKTFL